MFSTAVLLFCSFFAAFQQSGHWLNLTIKISAAGLAGWAAMHAAAYWGLVL